MKKSARDTKSLRESLAESLKQAVPGVGEQNAVSPTVPPTTEEPMAEPSNGKPAAVPEIGRLVRATIALKPNEAQKAEQILDLLMKSRKRRGGMSEAISIALRLCPLDVDQIGRASDENRASDRRKNKAKHKV